jgi:hypothetical protein
MRVRTLQILKTPQMEIPAGNIVTIPDHLVERLRGKVEPIADSFGVANEHSTEGKTHDLSAYPATAGIATPGASIEAIWTNPRSQGTPEARSESLRQVMTAIWETTFDRVADAWPRGFASTPEIRIADIEVGRVQALVLSGRASLRDFRRAVESWERIVRQGCQRFSPLMSETQPGGKN